MLEQASILSLEAYTVGSRKLDLVQQKLVHPSKSLGSENWGHLSAGEEARYMQSHLTKIGCGLAKEFELTLL